MRQVRDLIGTKGAAAARVVGPAEHSGLEEGSVEDQLRAALKQIEQGHFTLGPVELVFLLDCHPRHPPTLGGQRITGAGEGLLLHQHLLPRRLPLFRRDDRWFFIATCAFGWSLLSLLAAISFLHSRCGLVFDCHGLCLALTNEMAGVTSVSGFWLTL